METEQINYVCYVDDGDVEGFQRCPVLVDERRAGDRMTRPLDDPAVCSIDQNTCTKCSWRWNIMHTVLQNDDAIYVCGVWIELTTSAFRPPCRPTSTRNHP